jgi:hypothetical protein
MGEGRDHDRCRGRDDERELLLVMIRVEKLPELLVSERREKISFD